jgi:hypothetical protein
MIPTRRSAAETVIASRNVGKKRRAIFRQPSPRREFDR